MTVKRVKQIVMTRSLRSCPLGGYSAGAPPSLVQRLRIINDYTPHILLPGSTPSSLKVVPSGENLLARWSEQKGVLILSHIRAFDVTEWRVWCHKAHVTEVL